MPDRILIRFGGLAGFLLLTAPATACSDSCGDINCGSGVNVEWDEEAQPVGVAAVQLCVDVWEWTGDREGDCCPNADLEEVDRPIPHRCSRVGFTGKR